MNRKTIFILILTLPFFIVGCSNGGNVFEGTWSCDSALGQTSITIRHNGGNDFIIDDYPFIGKVSVTYQEGKLLGASGSALSFTIDKDSGKLLGMNICEMSRVN